MHLIGLARLGRDAEVRHTPQGKIVANLSLAFNYGQRGEDNRRPTQWIDAGLWGERAEKLAPHLVKGTLLCVTLDDPHIEEFRRGDGTPGTKLVARVAAVEFASAPPQDGGSQAPRASASAAQKPAPRSSAGSGFDDMDDDIPF